MRNRAIVIVLMLAVALCAVVSSGSAGMRASSPMLISAHGAQSTGLVWGGGNAPAPPPTQSISIGQHITNFLVQITRPSSRHFPGLGWWGDMLQVD